MHYVISDIHGCFDEFMNILSLLKIKDNDKVILLGDIIDRGPKTYEMLNWAMQNITDDGKYQMILGNHEDMLMNEYEYAVKQADNYNIPIERVAASSMYCQYGFHAYMRNYVRSVADVTPFVEWFKTLPLYKKIEVNGQKYVIAHAWYPDKTSKLSDTNKRKLILWHRDIDCFDNVTDEDYVTDDGEILIHGHTPVQILDKNNMDKPAIKPFYKPHVINIDCGCFFNYMDAFFNVGPAQIGGKLCAIRLEDKKIYYNN